MPDATEIRLAAERTALSWRRTCLGASAVALLLLRVVLDTGWTAVSLVPGVTALILLLVTALGYQRNRRLHEGAGGSGATTVRRVTAAVVVAVVITCGLVLFTL